MSEVGFIYTLAGTAGVYVGQTIRPIVREQEHKYSLERGRHPNHLLQRAIDEHGYGAFEFRVIQEDIPVEELNAVEQQWIDAIGTLNIATAGAMPNGPETRARIVASLKKTCSSPEWRARMSAIHKGKVTRPETKAKMSAAMKGRKLKPFSAEHRANISIAARNRHKHLDK